MVSILTFDDIYLSFTNEVKKTYCLRKLREYYCVKNPDGSLVSRTAALVDKNWFKNKLQKPMGGKDIPFSSECNKNGNVLYEKNLLHDALKLQNESVRFADATGTTGTEEMEITEYNFGDLIVDRTKILLALGLYSVVINFLQFNISSCIRPERRAEAYTILAKALVNISLIDLMKSGKNTKYLATDATALGDQFQGVAFTKYQVDAHETWCRETYEDYLKRSPSELYDYKTKLLEHGFVNYFPDKTFSQFYQTLPSENIFLVANGIYKGEII